MMGFLFVVFFKQKTAYEMRISDWSSDVCSSDLRGAVGADPLLGDGAGILLQIPDPLIRRWAQEQQLDLPQPGDYAVAMCFMPQDAAARAFVTEQFEKFTAKEGQVLIGWRDVPVTRDGLVQAVIDSPPVDRNSVG